MDKSLVMCTIVCVMTIHINLGVSQGVHNVPVSKKELVTEQKVAPIISTPNRQNSTNDKSNTDLQESNQKFGGNVKNDVAENFNKSSFVKTEDGPTELSQNVAIKPAPNVLAGKTAQPPGSSVSVDNSIKDATDAPNKDEATERGWFDLEDDDDGDGYEENGGNKDEEDEKTDTLGEHDADNGDGEDDFDESVNPSDEEIVDELTKKTKTPAAPTSMVLFYTWMIVAVLLIIVGVSTYQARCKNLRFRGFKLVSNKKEDRKRLIEHECV